MLSRYHPFGDSAGHFCLRLGVACKKLSSLRLMSTTTPHHEPATHWSTFPRAVVAHVKIVGALVLARSADAHRCRLRLHLRVGDGWLGVNWSFDLLDKVRHGEDLFSHEC